MIFTHGGGKHSIDDKEYPITEGAVHFIPKGVVHSITDNSESCRMSMVFKDDFFDDCCIKKGNLLRLSFFEPNMRGVILNFNQGDFVLIKPILMQIQEAFAQQKQDKKWKDLLEALIHLFFLKCEQQLLQQNANTLLITSDIRLPEIIQQLLEAIETHYKKRMSVEEYAHLLFISVSQLNRYCKTHLQKSVGELIHNVMLREAKNLLLHTQLSVKEIAWELGFEYPPNFIDFFVKKVGVSPMTYRLSG